MKCMLKQVFEKSKEVQKKIMPLSNLFNNRLNDFVNSSDKKNIISHCLDKNVTNSGLSAI